MGVKEIDVHLAEVLLGYVRLEGTVTRMDGSKCFWFTDRDGKQHKYATPRPNGEETLKKRYMSNHLTGGPPATPPHVQYPLKHS